MSRNILNVKNVTLVLTAVVLTAMTAGCGIGNTTDSASDPQTVPMTISGTVHGGEQPISGATVQLWQTGTTGYGTGAAQLVASTTTALHTGAFTFPTANVPANCTGTSGAYITASGGDPTGNTLTANNHAILLAAFIGGCNTTGASTSLIVNEVTTVAAAYALSNFSKVTQTTPTTLATLGIGAPTTNAIGLTDAAYNATVLATATSGGVANTGTSTVFLPTTMVNALADILSVCVDASEYNVYPCADQTSPAKKGLFSQATPPGGTAPTNVFQAAMNMAKYPGNNVAALLSLIPATPPFPATLAATTVTSTIAPNDLSLGIAYTNSTEATTAGASPTALAIDNSDNVWVIGGSSGTTTSTYNYIGELTSPSTGATYSTTLGSTVALDGTHTLRNSAFDTLGNLWMGDKNATIPAGGVVELPGGSISAAVEYNFASLSTLGQSDYSAVVDGSNNIWTANVTATGSCTATSGSICDFVEFPKSSSYAATNQFNGAAVATTSVHGLAADSVSSSSGKGNIWSGNYTVLGATTANNTITVLKPSTGASYVTTLGSTGNSPLSIALDATGGGYISTIATTATSGLYYVSQANSVSGSATVSSTVSVAGNATYTGIPNANSSSPASTATAPLAIGGLNQQGFDVVDGAGNVFLANYNYGTFVEYSPSLSAYVSPYYGFSPNIQVPAQTFNVTGLTQNATGTVTVTYTGNYAIAGQQVTFSGIPAGSYAFLNGNTYTVSTTSFTGLTIIDGGTTAIAKATYTSPFPTATASSTQAYFLCYANASTSTTSCTTSGNGTAHNNTIAIDRAGTVWTLGTNGTLLGLIGTAAPTNPILAAGASGSLP